MPQSYKMKYLLDTNVLSEPVKPATDDSVLKRLALFEREIATAAPVFYELQYGVRRLAESAKRRLKTGMMICDHADISTACPPVFGSEGE